MATFALDVGSRTEIPLLIAFADLTRFAAQSLHVSDERLAETIDAYYERVAARIEAAGGKLVKFVGDAALIVFQPEAVDAGIQALLDLKVDAKGGQEIGAPARLRSDGLGMPLDDQDPFRSGRRRSVWRGGRQALRRARQGGQRGGDARFDGRRALGRGISQARPRAAQAIQEAHPDHHVHPHRRPAPLPPSLSARLQNFTSA